MNDYKWVLIWNSSTKMYTLTGYVRGPNGEWSEPHGAPTSWSYIEAPLEHIRKAEMGEWRRQR